MDKQLIRLLFTYTNHNKDYGFTIEIYAYERPGSVEYFMDFKPTIAWRYGGDKHYRLPVPPESPDKHPDILALESGARIASHPKCPLPHYIAPKILELKRELVNPKAVQQTLSF